MCVCAGQYLAAAGSRLAVHHFESKTSLASVTTFEDHTADVTDVRSVGHTHTNEPGSIALAHGLLCGCVVLCVGRFGPDASFLVSTSMDRTVRVWNQRQAPAEG